ncbi:MAG: serine/threonine protein kinase [Bacteriovoracaceae bacterium]|nr:serine/threonine protein kinase [Bacteriovoracaceae bacterium]
MSPISFGKDLVLIELLGRGGMGEVYRAEIRKGDFSKTVAVKIPADSSEGFTRALIAEAQLVAQLRHPNIAQVYDVRVVDKQPAIVLEYIDGHDLRQLITVARQKGIHFSENFCLFVLSNILQALMYAHSQEEQVIHCDISPHNVMIDEFGTAKVLDFGISNIASNGSLNSYGGKTRYSRQRSTHDLKPIPFDDLYSSVLVLYELITLQYAFNGSSKAEVSKAIEHGKISSIEIFRTDLTPKFVSFVDDLIAIVVSEKNTSIESTLAKLKEFVPFEDELIKLEIINLLGSENLDKTFITPSVRSSKKRLSLFLFPVLLLCFALIAYWFFDKNNRADLIVENNSEITSYTHRDTSFRPVELMDRGELEDVACRYLCSEIGIHMSALLMASDGKMKAPPNSFHGFKDLFGSDNSLVHSIDAHCKKASVCEDATFVMRSFSSVLNSKKDIKLQKLKSAMVELNNHNPKALLTINLIQNFSESDSKLFLETKKGIKNFYKRSKLVQNISDISLKVFTIPDGNLNSLRSCRVLGDLLFASSYFQDFYRLRNVAHYDSNFIFIPGSSKCRFVGMKSRTPFFNCDKAEQDDSLYSTGVCHYKRESWDLRSLSLLIPDHMIKQGTYEAN